MRAAFVAAVAPVCIALVAHVCRADTPPSPWDLVRDPTLRARYDLHTEAQFRIQEARRAKHITGLAQRYLEEMAETAALLEAGGAKTGSDPVLKFDLAEVYEELGRHGDVIALLKPTIDAPSSPMATHPRAPDAMLTLAFAYAHSQNSIEERNCYRRYLATALDPRDRGTATLNLAEAEMHLENLDESVAQYREALRIATEDDERVTALLAVWGLAVALDRSGEPREAMQQAKIGANSQFIMALIDLANTPASYVFFEPAHEVSWYKAMAAMVKAEESPEPDKQVSEWMSARDEWDKYLVGEARNKTHRWTALARAHRERCDKALTRARERLAKQKPAAPPKEPGPREPWMITH